MIDPAGNSATVLDREIDVQNGPPAAPAVPVSPAVPTKPGPRRLPRAHVTLSVEPHQVNLRQRIHFSGRVLGGHIPLIGKLLIQLPLQRVCRPRRIRTPRSRQSRNGISILGRYLERSARAGCVRKFLDMT